MAGRQPLLCSNVVAKQPSVKILHDLDPGRNAECVLDVTSRLDRYRLDFGFL